MDMNAVTKPLKKLAQERKKEIHFDLPHGLDHFEGLHEDFKCMQREGFFSPPTSTVWFEGRKGKKIMVPSFEGFWENLFSPTWKHQTVRVGEGELLTHMLIHLYRLTSSDIIDCYRAGKFDTISVPTLKRNDLGSKTVPIKICFTYFYLTMKKGRGQSSFDSTTMEINPEVSKPTVPAYSKHSGGDAARQASSMKQGKTKSEGHNLGKNMSGVDRLTSLQNIQRFKQRASRRRIEGGDKSDSAPGSLLEVKRTSTGRRSVTRMRSESPQCEQRLSLLRKIGSKAKRSFSSADPGAVGRKRESSHGEILVGEIDGLTDSKSAVTYVDHTSNKIYTMVPERSEAFTITADTSKDTIAKEVLGMTEMLDIIWELSVNQAGRTDAELVINDLNQIIPANKKKRRHAITQSQLPLVMEKIPEVKRLTMLADPTEHYFCDDLRQMTGKRGKCGFVYKTRERRAMNMQSQSGIGNKDSKHLDEGTQFIPLATYDKVVKELVYDKSEPEVEEKKTPKKKRKTPPPLPPPTPVTDRKRIIRTYTLPKGSKKDKDKRAYIKYEDCDTPPLQDPNVELKSSQTRDNNNMSEEKGQNEATSVVNEDGKSVNPADVSNDKKKTPSQRRRRSSVAPELRVPAATRKRSSIYIPDLDGKTLQRVFIDENAEHPQEIPTAPLTVPLPPMLSAIPIIINEPPSERDVKEETADASNEEADEIDSPASPSRVESELSFKSVDFSDVGEPPIVQNFYDQQDSVLNPQDSAVTQSVSPNKIAEDTTEQQDLKEDIDDECEQEESDEKIGACCLVHKENPPTPIPSWEKVVVMKPKPPSAPKKKPEEVVMKPRPPSVPKKKPAITMIISDEKQKTTRKISFESPDIDIDKMSGTDDDSQKKHILKTGVEDESGKKKSSLKRISFKDQILEESPKGRRKSKSPNKHEELPKVDSSITAEHSVYMHIVEHDSQTRRKSEDQTFDSDKQPKTKGSLKVEGDKTSKRKTSTLKVGGKSSKRKNSALKQVDKQTSKNAQFDKQKSGVTQNGRNEDQDDSDKVTKPAQKGKKWQRQKPEDKKKNKKDNGERRYRIVKKVGKPLVTCLKQPDLERVPEEGEGDKPLPPMLQKLEDVKAKLPFRHIDAEALNPYGSLSHLQKLHHERKIYDSVPIPSPVRQYLCAKLDDFLKEKVVPRIHDYEASRRVKEGKHKLEPNINKPPPPPPFRVLPEGAENEEVPSDFFLAESMPIHVWQKWLIKAVKEFVVRKEQGKESKRTCCLILEFLLNEFDSLFTQHASDEILFGDNWRAKTFLTFVRKTHYPEDGMDLTNLP